MIRKEIMRRYLIKYKSRSFEEIVADWASFDEGVITFHTFTDGPYYWVSYELIETIKRKLAKPKDVIIDDEQGEMELSGKGAN